MTYIEVQYVISALLLSFNKIIQKLHSQMSRNLVMDKHRENPHTFGVNLHYFL